MKKIITTIIILLISYTAHAGHAGIYGRIEGGKDVDTENIYFTSVNIGYKFSVFGIQSRTFGGWKTWQEMNAPFSDIYSIGQAIQFKGLYVQIDHYCDHRVISNTKKNNSELHNNYKSSPQRMTIVKIGYEWEMK